MLIIWLQGIWLPLHGYDYESTPMWAGIYMVPLTIGFLVNDSGVAIPAVGATLAVPLIVSVSVSYLLDEAREYFDLRVGTEFSRDGAEIARATGAEVFVGGIEQISPERKFDCILAIQVIEHVYEPLTFVKQLVRRTQSGGHIVVATPDIGGVLRKVMGRHWPSFKVPEHVGYFDFRTLSRLMEKAGLRDVRRLPYPHAFPLGLITAKFGLDITSALGCLTIWVPATTIAVYGRVARD